MTTTDNQPTTAKSKAPNSAVHTQVMAQGRKQGHGDIGRVPVAVLAPTPPWRPLAAGSGMRRPVVAVPDSGVEPHPWLDGPSGDPIVAYATDGQWPPPADPVAADDVPYHGHATFVAGIIRQTAPDCQILSARVMGNDGIVQGDTSEAVLKYLADRVASGEPERFVDVVCLAYGFQPDSHPSTEDRDHLNALQEQLTRLVNKNVLVVASAGNYGNGGKTYPAAFADHSIYPGLAPNVVSVGAVNPDGHSWAYYTNYGPWVTHQAIGSGVISTMPAFDGVDLPEPLDDVDKAMYPDSRGYTIDPDNFLDGFARWSGTSFSAATVAGQLAQALADDPAPPSPERTARALATISARKQHPDANPS